MDKRFEPADIAIYIRDKGMVLKEKSLIAFHTETGKILAYGTEAVQFAENSTGTITVMSPLRQGLIADYVVAVKVFSYLLEKALGKKSLFHKPCVGVCIHKDMTEVEKKAMIEVLYQSGVSKVAFFETSAEQLIREFSENCPVEYEKFKVIIDITKEDSERYIAEELNQILEFVKRGEISLERTIELCQEILEQE